MPSQALTHRDSGRTGVNSGAVVIQTAFLGDLLLGVPLMRELKKNHGFLALVCRQGLGQPLKDWGLVDAVFEVEKGNRASYARVRKALQDTHWSLALSPHESLRSALLLRSITADRKTTYRRWYHRWIADRCVERDMRLPEVMRQLQLVSETGPSFTEDLSGRTRIDEEGWVVQLPAPPNKTEMWIEPLRERQLQRRREQPAASEWKMAVAPGSQWATKRWRAQGFAELMARDDLSQAPDSRRDVQWYLTGSLGERGLCLEIATMARKLRPGLKLEVLAGEMSWKETAEFFSDCDLLVGNDSGAQHLAALSGLPVVSIFGPTVVEQGYRPWIDMNRVVAHPALDCRPCGAHGSKACPLGHHRCMRDLSAEKVGRALKSLTAGLLTWDRARQTSSRDK